jgi:DNA polymerase III psi subunit
MNQVLAKYLFENETLYRDVSIIENPKIEEKTQVSKPESQEVGKSESLQIEKSVSQEVHKSESLIAEITKPIIILKHKVLILTNPITDSEKALLIKILGAVGISIEQVDLIVFNNSQSLDYQSFISQKITTHFISFGIGMSKLGWSMLLAPYQITKLEGINFLLADNLKDIESSQNLKKSLWGALQGMFTTP